jgi:hypothetical protein
MNGACIRHFFHSVLVPQLPIAKGSKIGVHPTKWTQNEKFRGDAFVGHSNSF